MTSCSRGANAGVRRGAVFMHFFHAREPSRAMPPIAVLSPLAPGARSGQVLPFARPNRGCSAARGHRCIAVL